jgi:nanoRNase/pAp phosphatase (c-di-AMP/oligoRNAs hydrolase)
MYERNSIKAFDIWKKLIQYWANKEMIINWIYYSSSLQDVVFKWKILQKIKTNKNLVYIYFTEKELEKEWIDRWSVKTSILELLKTIKWIDIFLSLDQTWDYLKGSLRSHKPIVNKIAHIFGWWWHPKASWFKIKLEKDWDKQVEKIINIINEEYIKIK